MKEVTKEELEKLGRRKIVIFAARCAERVLPISLRSELSMKVKDALRYVVGLIYQHDRVGNVEFENALALVRTISRELSPEQPAYDAVNAVITALHAIINVRHAAIYVMQCSYHSIRAVHAPYVLAKRVVDATAKDYEFLLAADEDFKVEDMGPLWPDGPPWEEAKSPPQSLSVIVDSDVDKNLLAEFFAELASLYSDLSDGDELIIREGFTPKPVEVPV